MGKHKKDRSDRSADRHSSRRDLLKRLEYLENKFNMANSRVASTVHRLRSRSRSPSRSRSRSRSVRSSSPRRSRRSADRSFQKRRSDRSSSIASRVSIVCSGGRDLRGASPYFSSTGGRNLSGASPDKSSEGYSPREIDYEDNYEPSTAHGSRNLRGALPNSVTSNDLLETADETERLNNAMSLTEKLVSNDTDDVLEINNDVDLSEDTLMILGTDPSKNKLPDFKFHDSLSSIWSHYMTNGVSKAELESLWNTHAVFPQNCNFEPPKMNPEIKVHMSVPHCTRDNAHLNFQIELGKGLNALGKALNALLKEDHNLPKKVKDEILPNLADSGKILTNLFAIFLKTEDVLSCPA